MNDMNNIPTITSAPAANTEKPKMKIVPGTQDDNYQIVRDGSRLAIRSVHDSEREVVFEASDKPDDIKKQVAEQLGLKIDVVPMDATSDTVDAVGLDEALEKAALSTEKPERGYKAETVIRDGAKVTFYSENGKDVGTISADNGKLFYNGETRQLLEGNFEEVSWAENGKVKTGWIKQGEIDTAHVRLDEQTSKETRGKIVGGVAGAGAGVVIAGGAYAAGTYGTALGLTTIAGTAIVAAPLVAIVATGAAIGIGVGWFGARRGWW